MKYISIPISISQSDEDISIERNIEDQMKMMDNLIELIIFTPRGSFIADPDFGLEYWNHEYANISDAQFNNNFGRDDFSKLSTKERCENSIIESIRAYAPRGLKVKDINVVMNFKDSNGKDIRHSKSHHEVVVFVSAKLYDGMGTTSDYVREISFMVEPTVKRVHI